MPLSVRLDPELEARIDAHSKETGLTKSRIIAYGVREYLDTHTGPTLYDIALGILTDSEVGATAPAKRAHSETHRKDYRAYTKKKHAHRTGARG
jgi:predicted transcriptional regulator